jgi:hypothetical protein
MAGAGGGHAAVLFAGMGWEARRAAGLGVRPETAAEATGRPPGFHWGRFRAAIHCGLPNCGGLESGSPFTQDVAGWDCPFTGGHQITVERRTTWLWLDARRAGSCHSLTPFKLRGTGERRCVGWMLGALGTAIHWWLSKLCGSGRWSRNLFRYQMRGCFCLWALLRGFTCFWRRTRLPVPALRNPPSPIFPFLRS